MNDKIVKTELLHGIEYTLDGKLHREDGPAIEYAGGSKEWYLHGVRHREDGPAREYSNGDKCWYLNDKLHREDGPAVEYSNGHKEYWVNGEYLDFITNDRMLIYYLKYGFLK